MMDNQTLDVKSSTNDTARTPTSTVWASISSSIRFCLGFVFLWSAIWKIYQPYEFLRDVYNYGLLGPKIGVLIATILPWLELLVGFALVLNVLSRGASMLSTILLSSFLMGQIHSLYIGLEIPCGCFGPNGDAISYRNVITTGFALVFSLTVLVIDSKKTALSS